MKKHLPSIGDTGLRLPVNDLAFRITDEISTMLAYWDNKLICRFANNAYMEWFGKTKEEMIDKVTMKEFLGPLYDLNLPYIQAVLAGNKQVFERAIPLPSGGIRHSLATYIPDILDGNVKGFFVHVADVSHIKKLEGQLLRARREMLRTVIEIQEAERSELATTITENINQTLASCNILLYGNDRIVDKTILDNVVAAIGTAIKSLNDISISLRPPVLEILGFSAAMESHIKTLKPKRLSAIRFTCETDEIELLSVSNKRFIFRIIQAFIQIVNEKDTSLILNIEITFHKPVVELLFTVNDSNYQLNRNSKQFQDILYRVDYFQGTIEEISKETSKMMRIVFSIE